MGQHGKIARRDVPPRVSLYVNTANPGLQGSWWPTSNTYMGTNVANPYGDCATRDLKAVSYMYGYAKAYDDANLRGVGSPASYLWWLDVEKGDTCSPTRRPTSPTLRA